LQEWWIESLLTFATERLLGNQRYGLNPYNTRRDYYSSRGTAGTPAIRASLISPLDV